jgi:hypothetical protein
MVLLSNVLMHTNLAVLLEEPSNHFGLT